MMKVRTARSTINHLWDDQGNKVVEVEKINEVALNFYKYLIGSSSFEFDSNKASRVSSLLGKKITGLQVMDVHKEVSEEEIRDVTFSMNSFKALGPNGYSAGFFKAAWPVVRG